MAQLVKHLTLDFSSGLDLRVMNSSPMVSSMLDVEPLLKTYTDTEGRVFPLEASANISYLTGFDLVMCPSVNQTLMLGKRSCIN